LDSDEELREELRSATRLVGLLLTYIENKGTLKDVAPWSDCINEDRLRWSMQIQNCVKCLHEAGVVWGDAKPENVLVDMKGDAWLIDFGGSYTPGWVDEDKQETVEGDLQGVQRIVDWLHECSRQPVTRIK
jgi:serine/threonine protein kinase